MLKKVVGTQNSLEAIEVEKPAPSPSEDGLESTVAIGLVENQNSLVGTYFLIDRIPKLSMKRELYIPPCEDGTPTTIREETP